MDYKHPGTRGISRNSSIKKNKLSNLRTRTLQVLWIYMQEIELINHKRGQGVKNIHQYDVSMMSVWRRATAGYQGLKEWVWVVTEIGKCCRASVTHGMLRWGRDKMGLVSSRRTNYSENAWDKLIEMPGWVIHALFSSRSWRKNHPGVAEINHRGKNVNRGTASWEGSQGGTVTKVGD